MKNKAKMLWAAGAVLVMALAAILLLRPFSQKAAGTIRITYTDAAGTLQKEKSVDFCPEDTLPELVAENFEGVSFSGSMLMSIEDFTTPEDWSLFISIYQNGEMALYGLNELPFADGDLIDLRVTVYDSAAWQ